MVGIFKEYQRTLYALLSEQFLYSWRDSRVEESRIYLIFDVNGPYNGGVLSQNLIVEHQRSFARRNSALLLPSLRSVMPR